MSPGPEDDIPQAEKRRVEAERARASTYHAFTAAEIDLPRDRFHQVNKASLVGQSNNNPWPQLPENSPWHGQHPDQYFDPRERDVKRDEPRQSFLRQSDDAPYVVGSTPVPWYPPAGGQADHSGQEPPLGYRVDELPPDPNDPIPEPGIKLSEARDIGGAAAPSVPASDVEPAPPSSKQPKRSK
jgi:hypothetical protein